MMKKIFFSALLLTLLSLWTINGQAASPTPDEALPENINSSSYILIDAGSSSVLCEKNADRKAYPASTTKILTAILALENGQFDQMMTASAAAVNDIGPDGMNIGLRPGEKISMGDLLNATLIYSANDAANVLAENLASDRKAFIDMMNAKAQALGAKNTHFTNASGIHDSAHTTTARDLALMAQYAMTLPGFREIVVKPTYTMAKTNNHNSREIRSVNKFLKETSDYFSQVDGIKSGFTSPAGWNLVSAASNKDGMRLIAVVMGDYSEKQLDADSKALLEFGFKHYSLQTLTEAGQYVQNVHVGQAQADTISLLTSGALRVVLPADQSKPAVKSDVKVNPDIKAPIKKGDVLGSVEYTRDGVSLGKVDLVSDRDIEAPAVRYFVYGGKTEESGVNPLETAAAVTPPASQTILSPPADNSVQDAANSAKIGVVIVALAFVVLLMRSKRPVKGARRRYKVRY